MAFTDKRGMDSSKFTSMMIVGLITAFVLYLLVAVNYEQIKKAADELKTFDVEEAPPPPPEKLPPPPPKQNLPPPPVVSPPPIVQTNQVMQPQVTTQATPPPVFVPTPEPPRAAPPPPPPLPAVRVSPRGNPGSWATNDDYPPSAQREGVEGTTGFRLEVGPDGRVTGCSVTSSSGSSTLDDTTCKLLTRRARFNPGRDAAGNAIGGQYSSRVKWQIQK